MQCIYLNTSPLKIQRNILPLSVTLSRVTPVEERATKATTVARPAILIASLIEKNRIYIINIILVICKIE